MLKVKRQFDLSDIYTKKRAESGKVLAKVLAKPSTVGFASRHRTWGTKSHKKLMRTCLECCNARIMSWAVKKASS